MDASTADGRSIEDQMWETLGQMTVEDGGSHFSVFSEEETIQCIFFQTSQMKRYLEAFPDVLYIDSTYCLNSFGYPVVVFMVVDGDNRGHCVGYALVRDERMVTFATLYTEFVRKNNVNTKTVVLDKDAAEIGAVRFAMEGVNLVLCRFHVCKSLSESIKKFVRKEHREEVKKLINMMVYSGSQAAFEDAYAQLSGEMKTFFDSNWLPVKQHWAQCDLQHIVTWGNMTNNFVERHNRALKTVGNSKMTMSTFIKSLLKFHSADEVSMRRRIIEMSARSKVLRPKHDGAQFLTQASKTLTHFACDLLKKQWDILKKKTVFLCPDADVLYVLRNEREAAEYSFPDGKCDCTYFLNRGLPCWHMMGYWCEKGQDIMSYVFPDRYKKDKLLECLSGDIAPVPSMCGTVNVVSQSGTKTTAEKASILKNVCRELVAVGSECSQDVFEERYHFLKSVVHAWRSNESAPAIIEDHLQFADQMVWTLDNVPTSPPYNPHLFALKYPLQTLVLGQPLSAKTIKLLTSLESSSRLLLHALVPLLPTI